MRYQRLKLLSLMSLLTLTLALAPVAMSAPTKPDATPSSAAQAPATAPASAPTPETQAPTPETQAPASETQAPASAEIAGTYSGNAKSKVFHRQGCRYFSCKTCTLIFASPAEATAKGFKPCKICMK